MFPFHITFIDMQPKIMILRCCWTSLLFSRLINFHFSICFLAFKIKHCFTPLTINVPVSFHLASFRASVLILFWRIAIFIVTILRFDPSSEILFFLDLFYILYKMCNQKKTTQNTWSDTVSFTEQKTCTLFVLVF